MNLKDMIYQTPPNSNNTGLLEFTRGGDLLNVNYIMQDEIDSINDRAEMAEDLWKK